MVYRGGDAVAGWIFAGLMARGLGLAGTAVVAIPVAGVWVAVALWLGRRHRRLRTTAARDRVHTEEEMA